MRSNDDYLLWGAIVGLLVALAAACLMLINPARSEPIPPSAETAVVKPKPQLVIPRTPAAAAALAALDRASLPPEARYQRVYIWLSGGSMEEAAVANITVNTGPNLAVTDYPTRLVAGGALFAVDLSAMVDDPKQLEQLLNDWNDLADDEPYFTVSVVAEENGHQVTRRVPAPYLGQAGIDMWAQMRVEGHGHQFQFCPIVSLGWFTTKALTAADEGFYYKFRHLVAGKTKLNDYLLSRGVSKESIERRNAVDQEICLSKVTGRARGIEILAASVKPSALFSIVGITSDNRYDRVDPKQDPGLSLLDHAPDALEVIVTLPNGWLEYTLWDAEEKLLVEADQKVVTDNEVPTPYPKRLQPAISCIRCHGKNDGWMPFLNEYKLMVGDRGKLLSDLSKGTQDDKQFEQFRKIMQRFNGDLLPVIKDAQDSYDRHFNRVTGLDARTGCGLVSMVFAAYNYTPVTAMDALRELGFKAKPNDAIGVETFREVCPPLDSNGLVPDHGFIVRLSTLYRDPDTAQPKGLALTRLQWEQIYADLALRSYRAQQQALHPPKVLKTKGD